MRGTIRFAGRATGAVLLALALSGCIKLQEDLTLKSDDTVDGTIVFAVNEELLKMSGMTAEDFFQQMPEGQSPLPEGVEFDTEPYEDDTFVGQTYTFSDVPIATMSGSAGEDDIVITRQGDTFRVSGSLDLSTGTTGMEPGAQAMMDSFEVRISVTFPGAVESATGEIDGKTVTWEPEFGDVVTIEAVGSAIESGGMPLWILLIAAVAVVAVVAVVMMRGKGSKTPAEGAVPPGAAGEWSAAAPEVAPEVASDPASPAVPPAAPGWAPPPSSPPEPEWAPPPSSPPEPGPEPAGPDEGP